MTYTEATSLIKNKILDAFHVCKRDNVPIWFLPQGIADTNDVVLCNFSEAKLMVGTLIEEHEENSESKAYNIKLRLQERT